MIEIIAFIIAVVIIFYILLPIFYKETFEVKNGSAEIAELEKRIEIIKNNISDLHLDYQMEKLSKEDYNLLKKDYIKEIDRINKKVEIIKKREFSKIHHDNILICPKCGKENSTNYKFCSRCGKKILKNDEY